MSTFDSQVSKNEILKRKLNTPVYLFLIGNHRTKLFFTRYNDRQSSEQNNRKLISLHNNGEDEKHAHGFADF